MDNVAINSKTHSLHEVMQSIQSVLLRTYANRVFWVRCELSRISLHAQSGHCYLDLIDKNEASIVAQQRGIIWSDRYNLIFEKFKAVTNTPLADGMKVLLHCSVNFHPVHGLSFTVTDIDPSFTLGEMARMKNESIARLKSEGLFNKNRQLKLPLLPARIAVVSVATSRGYHDFISTIENHHRQYAIKYKLFDAILQGENAVPSLIRAVKLIMQEVENFDAIAIIRGGAGDAGLACYDEFSLSALIAGTTLPVITGIGHATNETVVEMVAFKNCITPTAAATFILEKFDMQFNFLAEQIIILKQQSLTFVNDEKQNISLNLERFSHHVRNHLNHRGYQLKSLFATLPSNISHFFSSHKQNINQAKQILSKVNRLGNLSATLSDLNRKVSDLKIFLENNFSNQRNKISEESIRVKNIPFLMKNKSEYLEHLSEKVNLLDPVNTLKRGYSITRYNGKALTDSSSLLAGSKIETELVNGVIKSTVDKSN